MSYQLNSVIAADVRTAPPIGTPTLLRGGSLPESDYEQRSALCIGNLHAPVNADSTTGGNALAISSRALTIASVRAALRSGKQEPSGSRINSPRSRTLRKYIAMSAALCLPRNATRSSKGPV